ncbi:electron transfer flavoprotein beta subunit lysine methyltransferase [Bufo gargarizans]|uniref:electron transfer flavoprotein beta subunit lysine methyltransferase n=1 Tax=Bufo gargarizans TaxID=30331 RepID=UPI001CF5071B|nr:electron transfer flavoprotein beta subunit lysine methyltransferase [Bufo gargarizans]
MLRLYRSLLRPFHGKVLCCSAQHTSATYLQSFILHNTEVVTEHLTPEIQLLLLTPRCKFWHLRPEHWPYGDPYWAIYWPGGQALARYLLDNPDIVRHRRILDLGSGCGATSIAAKMKGASYVVANDIDPVAGAAFGLNCQLNRIDPLPFQPENVIGEDTGCWDLIVLGDMFYDERLANSLHRWLRHCMVQHGTTVLIGDPGRGHFLTHPIQKQLRKIAEYNLPESSKQENYGLTTSAVWRYEPGCS